MITKLDKNKKIELTDLIENSKYIDVISVESAGRPLAKDMEKKVGNKIGNFINIRPTNHAKQNQIIEWVNGDLNPKHTALVCDDFLFQGNTLNVVLDYLMRVGYKSRNLYVCVGFGEEKFFNTRKNKEIGLLNYNLLDNEKLYFSRNYKPRIK
ncbi:phosphoribosyltransferase domain-containing protein [Candidatus Pacearchaeota archaeon]|jgi:orotate phosphoribosyltransferase-like protein|nr:phosphoribosyltransferase domain-containing protein [Candidatus Pacearchaeota archaeon]